MPGRRSTGLLMLVLGSLVLPSMSHSQHPLDSELTLELLQRIEQLEAEVRQIRGELEIYRHQVEMLQQERAMAGYPAQPSGAAEPAAGSGATDRPPAGAYGQPAPVQPPLASAPPPSATERMPSVQSAPPAAAGTEQADFDTALGELREGRYPRAAADLQRFLNAYPNSSLAGDAQYWLGESRYLSRDYDAAKDAFINLGLRYPQSARLPDALLKLGYIYGEQGDTARAQEVLRKLVQVYPDTQAASLAERRLQSLR
jgi:tol-pal system protein YbgF